MTGEERNTSRHCCRGECGTKCRPTEVNIDLMALDFDIMRVTVDSH